MATSDAPQGAVDDSISGPVKDAGGAAGGQETPSGGESGNAEAKKWRKKLRDTEAELGRLREQVETMQRDQVDGMAAAAGVKPQAIWAVTDLDGLLDPESGVVDAALVSAAMESARETLGVQPVGKGSVVPGIGAQPTYTPSPQDEFTDAFRPHRR